jgi:methionine--tRNA ligase beta chain
MISFDDFNKLEIRIGTILEAEKVEGADKLLKLLVDIGDEKRTLVAGIAQDYQPKDIIGKQIPILANLEPKKLRGIESQGMILAVDIEGKATLLHPDKEVPNGSKVR